MKTGFFSMSNTKMILMRLEEFIMSEDVISKAVRYSMLSMEQWRNFS